MLSAALDLVWPWAIKHVIDGIVLAPATAAVHPFNNDSATGASVTTGKFRQLGLFGVAVLAVLLLKQAIDSVRTYQAYLLNARVLFRLRGRLFERLLSLPLHALAELKSGGIVARLSGDVDSVSGLVQMAIISPGVALIRIVLTVGILFALSWRLAVAALVMLPPIGLVSFVWLRKVRPIYRSARDDAGAIDGRVSETFGGIRVVRAFRRETREERGYAVGHHTIIRKGLFAQKLEMALEGAWGLLIPATSLVIVGYGAVLALHDPPRAGVGDIFAFQIYVALLLQPVYSMIASISATQKSLAATERVFEVLEMPPDKPDRPGALDAPDRVRELRLDHVGFEYRPGIPVLRDIDLTIPGGSTVALVGPSGAGKTTLTDLIARFQDPTTGAVRLNGTDLRDFKLTGYRSLLAVVQQETFLFDGSVRENIAYGRRGATEADVFAAAQRANAHDFITRLPEGYDTVIGERGFTLSGGQKQRLSIARAVLADPLILILDEATSNLDTESEQQIQSALADLAGGRTTFVIAHRLSTVADADLIVVLEAGSVAESGTHEQLMRLRGAYHKMVERQRESFDAGE